MASVKVVLKKMQQQSCHPTRTLPYEILYTFKKRQCIYAEIAIAIFVVAGFWLFYYCEENNFEAYLALCCYPFLILSTLLLIPPITIL